MPSRSSLFYHRAALTHLAQLVVIVLAAVFALMTLSIVLSLVALLLLEVLLVAFVPRLGLFRACVDGALLRREREVVAVAHTALLASMRSAHASELTTLERLAGEVTASWGASEAAVDRALGIEGLLATFGRLALSYRRNADAFTNEGWAALEAETARLENLPPAGCDEWIERRRAIVEMRRRTWIRASQDRDVMLQALGTIGEVVRFIHELSTVASDDPGHAEVDRVLQHCTHALARVRRLEVDPPTERTVVETSTHVPLGPKAEPDRQPAPTPAPDGIPLRLVAGVHV